MNRKEGQTCHKKDEYNQSLQRKAGFFLDLVLGKAEKGTDFFAYRFE